MDLKKYWSKRNFAKTQEPKGILKPIKKTPKRLFIIQKHAASHLHYDFRLELQGVLLSWAIPKGPSLDPQIKRLAMHVEDHPLAYGNFEGTIPKGEYGGGTVMLWDKGEWIPEDDNPVKAYKAGHLKFTLKAKKLSGSWKLIRINNNDKTWLLIKAKDDSAQLNSKYDITKKQPLSVKSGMSMQEIADKNPTKILKKTAKAPLKKPASMKHLVSTLPKSTFPKKISPQLATLVDKPPEGSNWVHEIKFDGYRFLAMKKNGKTNLISRNGKDWSNKFANVLEAVNELPVKNVILDGEIVILDENQKSNFQLLQNAIKNQDQEFIYYLFDLLYLDNYSLTNMGLLERKTLLHHIIPSNKKSILRYSDHIVGNGALLLKKTCELSLEGIVSKEIDSKYAQKRTYTWLKSKCIKRQEFIICGFTEPQSNRKYFGSLLLGAYNAAGDLIYHGNVGTGFDAALLKSLHRTLTKIKIKSSPFKTPPKEKLGAITWIQPKMIAEIEFAEWTSDNKLRHASFKGLRSDKSPKKITKEVEKSVDKIDKKKQTTPPFKTDYMLTHPEKILYKEDKITKQDLADYYQAIHQWILPYIANRPLALLRCPEGYEKCFYQKHLQENHADNLYSISIKEKKGRQECIYLKDESGLMALVQMGVLEIHPWGSQIDEIEYPDFIVFDLDPDPKLPWKSVVAAANEIKQHLTQFKLKSFVKTTGGKGLHIVVPIKAEYRWDEVKNFAKTFVDFLVQNNAKKYVGKMSKALRKGKIFIDYLRNQRGATAVAPYSTRARIHAPVSMPIAWDELTDNFEDTYYTIKSAVKRLNQLKKDPWKDFYKNPPSLRLDEFK